MCLATIAYISLCSMHSYVLLFSVLVVNFTGFKFYGVTHSYSSCPFLCVLASVHILSVNTRGGGRLWEPAWARLEGLPPSSSPKPLHYPGPLEGSMEGWGCRPHTFATRGASPRVTIGKVGGRTWEDVNLWPRLQFVMTYISCFDSHEHAAEDVVDVWRSP